MIYTTLGRTDLRVSALCLGSMTWGTQNTETEGHAQIDMALDRGLNFIDTAEMYPVNPISKETTGRTEEIIGNWIAKTGRRNDVVIATKVAGAGNHAVRDGAPISAATIDAGIEGSLKRLRTDVIDLYQLHWPNRGSYMFRRNWTYDPSQQNRAETLAHMQEVLGALRTHVEKGNLRYFGVSNESAWGTTEWLRLARASGAPEMHSLQNEYSLLCRLFDTDLAELCVNEGVDLLAFSPLAAGLLTGKYQNGAVPEGSRKAINPQLGGRDSDRVYNAVAAYLEIARRHGLDPSQMALSWCLTRPFKTIPIFGATTLRQLQIALGSVEVTLSDEILDEIATVHKAHPMPY